MLGILLIDKEVGWTSHDVVGRLRRILGTRRIGHAGTLDPLASGLLVVAVGPATRFLQFLPLEPKVYEAEIEFGSATTTYDKEGEVTLTGAVPADLYDQICGVLGEFVGLQEQLPPIYSAVKVAGKPMYEYARKGQAVERRPRTIHIEEISLLSVTGNSVKLKIECSGGTYVRTLADDLGQRIGCGAHLAGLVRTQVGSFTLDRAVKTDRANSGHLIPLVEALQPIPIRTLDEKELGIVQNGGSVPARGLEGEFAALLTPAGDVVAVAAIRGNHLQPECVIPLEGLAHL